MIFLFKVQLSKWDSSLVTAVVDTFANENEGSAYICRYSWISGEANVCNLEQ